MYSKKVLWFTAAIALLVAGNSAAETCTAPGHPSCTVTCSNGCVAAYWEPSGPCRTSCSNGADFGALIGSLSAEKGAFSISVLGLAPTKAAEGFGAMMSASARASVEKAAFPISLEAQKVTSLQFQAMLQKVSTPKAADTDDGGFHCIACGNSAPVCKLCVFGVESHGCDGNGNPYLNCVDPFGGAVAMAGKKKCSGTCTDSKGVSHTATTECEEGHCGAVNCANPSSPTISCN